MRALFGRLALLLGAFALAASAVAFVWGRDAAHRVPLDTDSYTYLTGTASGALAKSETPVPVTDVVHTQIDPKASTGDVVAMQQVGCIATTSEFCIDPKGKVLLDRDDDAMVNFSIDKFAIDRDTAVAVSNQKAYIKDGSAVLPYSGLVTKWPFDTKKKSYPYWDSRLEKSVTATYAGTKKIHGLETYRFDVSIPSTTTEIAEGTQGTYEATQTLWVDPKTGAFIDQAATQKIALDDGSSVLDIDLSYTDKTVKENVDTAKSNRRSLFLIDVVARFGGLVLGLILIVVGVVLLRRPARAGAAPAAPTRATTSV